MSLTTDELTTIREIALNEITRAIEDSVVRVMADMERFCGGSAPKGFVKELTLNVLKAQMSKLKKEAK